MGLLSQRRKSREYRWWQVQRLGGLASEGEPEPPSAAERGGCDRLGPSDPEFGHSINRTRKNNRCGDGEGRRLAWPDRGEDHGKGEAEQRAQAHSAQRFASHLATTARMRRITWRPA